MDKPLLIALLVILLGIGNILFSAPENLLEAKPYTLNDMFIRGYAHNWQQIYDIQRCESGYEINICNQEFGCKAGMGLWQIIPSTLKYCEEKLGRELDPFDYTDNNDCGMWLLINEGDRHWEQSEHCWGT